MKKIIFLIMLLPACLNNRGLVTISSREVIQYDKEEDSSMQVRRRDPETGIIQRPSFFVKEKDTQFKQKSSDQADGSLFKSKDKQNNLFADADPWAVGSYLPVQVLAMKKPMENKSEVAKTTKPNPTDKTQAAPKDELEDKLLSSLPDFEPANGSQSILKFIPMRITERFENGDVLCTYEKFAQSPEEESQTIVTARIPYQAFLGGNSITTDDLTEVHFVMASQTEALDKRSPGWEDEYTLRASGYSEARSKQKIALDEKRKQLEEARKNLETNMRGFLTERKTYAQEREKLRKQAFEQEEKIKELEKKVPKQEDAKKAEVNQTQPQPQAG